MQKEKGGRFRDRMKGKRQRERGEKRNREKEGKRDRKKERGGKEDKIQIKKYILDRGKDTGT